MKEHNQTIQWFNYWWQPRPIRNVTIKNITEHDDGHMEGEYHNYGQTMRVTRKCGDSIWRFV